MGSAAVRQATEYYGSALDASSHLRAHPQDVQDLSGQEILGEVVDVRLRMRDAMWTQLRFPELLENLREADDIAQSLGDRRRLGWVACYLCCYFWSVAELEEARAAGDRALQIALEIDDRALLAETNFYRGLTQKATGAFGESVTTVVGRVARPRGSHQPAEVRVSVSSLRVERSCHRPKLPDEGPIATGPVFRRHCPWPRRHEVWRRPSAIRLPGWLPGRVWA